jgi:MFS family permease
VAFAITITLMLRPLGALIFGMFADNYGRRGPLMASVLVYSVIELVAAFSPNFTCDLRRYALRRALATLRRKKTILLACVLGVCTIPLWVNAPSIATPAGGADYAHALMTIMFGVFIAVFILTIVGPERKNVAFVDEVAPAA